MATKTSMLKSKQHDRPSSRRKEKKNSHLSSLIMLSSQLLGQGRFNEGLPSFITNSLDSEQIWQQLELRNEHKLSFPACTREIVKISSSRQRRKQKEKRKIKDVAETVEEEDSKNEEQENSSDTDSSEEEDGILDSIKKRLEEDSLRSKNDEFDALSDSEDQDELDFDFEMDNEISKGLSDDEEEDVEDKKFKKEKQHSNVKKRTTIVDDKFFKLADMEEFLESEDLKEEKKMKREKKDDREDEDDDEDDDDEDDDEEIDMFGELDSDEDEGRSAKYNDFFDPPDGKVLKKNKDKNEDKENEIADDEAVKEDEENDDDDEEEDMDDEENDVSENDNNDNDDELSEDREEDKQEVGSKSQRKVSFRDDLLQSDEDEEEPHKKLTKKETKSTFELKQEQLQEKAREMEELSLKEAPWELTGETTASKRPENSLLDTVLDFQHTTRPAPVITDDTTKSLEDYIKQRIKDKTFDDVERKEKPKEDVFEFKKRIVLDQEKSKISLGELYEQEFLKQQQQDTEEVKADPECEKIKKELNKLFHQLDALSNFRYTPMRPGTEVKIIVNTPAIAMEEVAPVATADSELLAPEEVHDKRKGDLKAVDERSSTDKKRARRQKKQEKREKKKAKEAREKLVQKMKPGLGNKYSKAKALKQLEEISKSDKNVTMIKGDSKKLGSSTSFFTQLQEEVQTNAKAKKASKEKKRKVADASKLML